MKQYIMIYDWENYASFEAESLSELYFKIIGYFGNYYPLNEKQLIMLCDDFSIKQFVNFFESKNEHINSIYEIKETIYMEEQDVKD